MDIKPAFLKVEDTVQPLHVNHHLRAGTVCFSSGSNGSAPGLSAGVSTTSASFAILNKIDCISVTAHDLSIVEGATYAHIFPVFPCIA